MEDSIDVKITTETAVAGREPLVLIGPNGSGKTRHGVQMAQWNNADMIGALRNIALGETVSMQPTKAATKNLQNLLGRRRSKPWELSNEIDHLFSKLLAEDASKAVDFRAAFLSEGDTARPARTKLMQLAEVWKRLFPGRTIDFAEYSPRVESEYSGGGATYAAQQMSDGERVALYLAARVLDSSSNVIIVDEPEVHFHGRLAMRFWSELEAMRPECRFVYITHDLPFALSRANAKFIIIRPDTALEPVQIADDVPAEIVESLLAAASVSIHAQRVVFCEGRESSLDAQLYNAWFSERETSVVPVDSCHDVVRCVRAFRESMLVTGLSALGVIDRDYWPDSFLSAIPYGVTVLPFHEVESLFCSEEVFCAVAEHLSIEDAEQKHREFIQGAAAMFDGGLKNKQISERFRQRCRNEIISALNALDVSDDPQSMEAEHKAVFASADFAADISQVFDEEKAAVEQALSDSGTAFLRVLPGKVFLARAARALEISVDRYVELVTLSLNAPAESPLSGLGSRVAQFLETFLPPRVVATDPE